jgi:hypothetical protein
MPGSSKWSFHSGFPSKTMHYSFPHACYILHISHHLFDSSKNILWRVEIMNMLIIQSSSFLCYLSLLCPDIILSTPISNTLSLCSSLLVRDQASHLYKTTCKVRVLCISIFTFLGSKTGCHVILDQMLASAFCCCWFLYECSFDMLGLFTDILNLPHFQRIYYMCLCVVILCCMLLMKQKHIFSFLNIYF